MFKVEGERLSLTRGDDAYLYVGAALPTGSKMALYVYRDANMSSLLFSREQLPDGSFLIQHADTDMLPVGKLYYKIVAFIGGVNTVVVGPETLTVLEEVH